MRQINFSSWKIQMSDRMIMIQGLHDAHEALCRDVSFIEV